MRSHIDYPGKVNKPLISLQLVNNDGKLEEFDALLDPGSYSYSYIAKHLILQKQMQIQLATYIDKHGISFTKEKKDKVFEFRSPEKHHEMKSFLGLCSQYRDHIPNYAQMSAPLHQMIK